MKKGYLVPFLVAALAQGCRDSSSSTICQEERSQSQPTRSFLDNLFRGSYNEESFTGTIQDQLNALSNQGQHWRDSKYVAKTEGNRHMHQIKYNYGSVQILEQRAEFDEHQGQHRIVFDLGKDTNSPRRFEYIFATTSDLHPQMQAKHSYPDNPLIASYTLNTTGSSQQRFPLNIQRTVLGNVEWVHEPSALEELSSKNSVSEKSIKDIREKIVDTFSDFYNSVYK